MYLLIRNGTAGAPVASCASGLTLVELDAFREDGFSIFRFEPNLHRLQQYGGQGSWDDVCSYALWDLPDDDPTS